MNEHGLAVSFTGAGIFGVPLQVRGFAPWVVIRSLLDWCRSTDDALERLESVPVSGHLNLLLVDREDEAALVEYADGQMSIKRIGGEDSEPFVFSTNHYDIPEMTRFNRLNCGILGHSKKHHSLIGATLQEMNPRVRKEDIRTLLSRHHPHGLCSHLYKHRFGTLWSVIYDLTAGRADVCFGAPTHNDYETFGLADSVGIKACDAIIPLPDKD
jgi:predicted choloylglycine hydrolase